MYKKLLPSLAKMTGFYVVAISFLATSLLCDGTIAVRRRLGPPPVGPPNARAAPPEWGTITQRVDHFNPTDLRTWEMRYINNSQFFQDGGPIFTFLGGEWEIDIGRLMTGQIFDMAQEHNGYMFYTEHRYYGNSFPTQNLSSANLQFLSIDQSLADLAYFIRHKKQTIAGLENSKVVVIGGSYSASMATWARLKYPHLIDIGYASSAPVRAVADFYEYYEVVNDNIGLVSQECLDTIGEGIVQLEARLETEEGITYVSETFKTCSRLRNEEPYRSYFFNVIIAEIFAGLVQYAGQYSIQNDCNFLLATNGSALEQLTAYVRDYFGNNCIDDYDDFIARYSSPNLTSDAYRPWLYQTCTEYGYYQTTTSQRQPFGDTFALKFFIDMCGDLFGAKYDETVLDIAVNRTNIVYGSLTPELTKVVSVHGTVDPWHALGILEDLNPSAPAILINGTSHCADLNSVSDYDLPQLREAKIRVKQLVTEWLSL